MQWEWLLRMRAKADLEWSCRRHLGVVCGDLHLAGDDHRRPALGEVHSDQQEPDQGHREGLHPVRGTGRGDRGLLQGRLSKEKRGEDQGVRHS